MLRIILLLCALLPFNLYAQEAKLVETIIAKKQVFTSQVNLIGTITSKQETVFTAKYNGILTEIYLSDGATAKRGTIIAELENEDTSNNYQLATQSEKIAREQYDRALKLHTQGYLKREEFEDKKQKWHLERQNLTKAKKQLEDSYLRAPFDGKLGIFKAKQGSHLKAGSEIVAFYNPNQMQIELNIPENLAAKISTNTEVLVLGKKFKISSIEYIVNKETRMVDAKIDLDEGDNHLNFMIGNIVEVFIIMNKKEAALVIPKSAIFMKEGKSHLFKIKEGKALSFEVKIGEQTDKMVEIIEGLEEGDSVILYGQSNIQDGNPVEVYSK
ncbi:efflux RND transporter periplasmic adaptor subunit [Candidatus Jidaibacter acanthamoebae]|nr:efflux RND transporter periplasmic adaptor subunit [Candidatus Jidaibacter acanthamoeba]